MEINRQARAYPGLRIDIEACLVQLGPAGLRDQWIDFYVLLALAPLDSPGVRAYVSAEELARVGPWRHKTVASVGKEVARHLAWLEQQGLADAVSSRGRTKAWCLEIPVALVDFRPGRVAVEAWASSRSSQVTAQETWIDTIARLVEAMAALQQGQAESALEHASKPLGYQGEPALAAWSALLVGRAAFQHDDQELLIDTYETWLRRPDAVGKSVGSRLRALVAFKNRFEDTTSSLSSLRKLAADLEVSGDVSALAAVLNIMGVLSMRMSDTRAGLEYHLRAAALFGIAGDFPSLQGALFNLANCRRRAQMQANLAPDEGVFKLIELCRLVCKCFGVGADSAQAEIAAARWALEMTDIPRARQYLVEAEKIVIRIESSFDQACFLVVRAELEHADPTGECDPLRDLNTALRIYREIQDKRSIEEAERLLKLITKARRERQT